MKMHSVGFVFYVIREDAAAMTFTFTFFTWFYLWQEI